MQAQFTHRFNPDGSIDSICVHCFVTVASSSREPDLDAPESAHVCNCGLLEHFRASLKENRIFKVG